MADENEVVAEVGLKEVLEVVNFIEQLGVKAAGALKDGAQLNDLLVLFDKDLLAKGQLAFEGVGSVGAELNNLSLDEAALLASRLFMAVKAIVAEAKKV